MLQVLATYRGKESKIQIKKDSKVLDVLKKMEINPETVIVRKNKEIVTEREKVKGKDILEIIRIVSGG